MFGIGITEIAVLAIIATCPLVILYIALYMARSMSGGGTISKQTLFVEALARRMDAMEERMTALETILRERDSKE